MEVSTTPSESDLISFYSSLPLDGDTFEIELNEARFGLARILPYLPAVPETFEVLEVGAGHCLLSGYLATKGYRVSAVEPLGSEFDFMADIQKSVLQHCDARGAQLDVVRMTGEQIAISDRYDLAFSINALEHMRDPLQVIDNMHRSLKPGGTLLLHCPNYSVPFEPHFNLILVTRSKRINTWLYRSRISHPDIWEELNFIRYKDLRRHFARNRLSFRFDRTLMCDTVLRAVQDPVFALRRSGFQRAICTIMDRFGLAALLRFVPATMQTPMEVAVTKSPAKKG
jgi:SAM-dependent methyltransferase